MIEETVSVKEAARLKNVTEAAIRLLVANPSHPLRGVRCGGRIRVTCDSLSAYKPKCMVVNRPRVVESD